MNLFYIFGVLLAFIGNVCATHDFNTFTVSEDTVAYSMRKTMAATTEFECCTQCSIDTVCAAAIWDGNKPENCKLLLNDGNATTTSDINGNDNSQIAWLKENDGTVGRR